jgi:hypothetical protein
MNILVGQPWQYSLAMASSLYLSLLTLAMMICLLMPINKARSTLGYSLIIIVITAAYLVISHYTHIMSSNLLTHTPPPQLKNAIQYPYGAAILIPAYISYIGPTIASFIIYSILKDRLLKFSALKNALILAALIMTMHAGMFSIVQMLYSQGNVLYRIFYYGQFLWEYAALGIFTAYAFKFSPKITVYSRG